jgi:iron complex outermembrane receptor protein
MNPDTLFYASYSTGFKSGGINNITSVLAADQLYWQPETTDAIELGMKSEFLDNRVRLNTALFFQTYDDFQVTQNIPGEARTIVTNAAEVESSGVEMELTAAVTDMLTVNGSLTWVISEYETNEHQACTVVAGTGYPGTPDGRYPGCVQTANGGWERDISGEQLDHAPKLSFNLGAELRDSFSLIDGVEWFGRADVVYKGEQNLEVWLPSEAEEGSYYLVNARAGLESGDGWKVTAWVNNLLDEDYVAEAYWTGTNPIFRRAEFHQIPGIERTYGVTVDYSF